MNFAENFTAENGKEERFCERFGRFNPDAMLDMFLDWYNQ